MGRPPAEHPHRLPLRILRGNQRRVPERPGTQLRRYGRKRYPGSGAEVGEYICGVVKILL